MYEVSLSQIEAADNGLLILFGLLLVLAWLARYRRPECPECSHCKERLRKERSEAQERTHDADHRILGRCRDEQCPRNSYRGPS